MSQGIGYTPFHEIHVYINRLGSSILELRKGSKHHIAEFYKITQQIQKARRDLDKVIADVERHEQHIAAGLSVTSSRTRTTRKESESEL